jgi:hypothetical protein
MTARLRKALLYVWFVALAAVLSAAFAQPASSAPGVPPPPPATLPTNMPLHSPPRLAGSSALSLDESTIAEISFEPLTPSELLCPDGKYNWYGKCVNVFRLFGHTSPKDYSINLLTLSKASHAVGVAIDKSVTPNRVYVADSGNNRILGWRSLGQCSASHAACTFTSECGGSGGTCDVDPLKPADLVIGTPARCNRDSNIGNLGLASADSLCLMPFPQDSNMLESSFPVPLTVNSSGDLLVTDLWNNRVLRFNDPFGTDTVADFVWGQTDFTGTKPNQGRGVGSPSDSSFSFYAPGRDAQGSPGASVDAGGNTWIADNQNGRVLRFPAGSQHADLVLGQGDFFSMSDQHCWTNSADVTITPPLNTLCGPVVARVHPATGELWVLDNGYLGGHIGRISVFTPPFSNGMFASREIKPNIASLIDSYDGTTIYSPYWSKGFTFQWNEDLADYPNGVLWLNEAWQGSGQTGRVLLLGATGDVLATIGSTGANMTANWVPGACGEMMRDYYSWSPTWIAVSGRNLLTSNNTPSTVSRYELPALNSTSDSTLCPPRAVGGLLDNTTFWSTPSPETMTGWPLRVVARAGQLAVGDGSNLKVWNNYLARPFGAAPDFELPNPGNAFAQFAPDDNGYLWNARSEEAVIEAYRWPLTPSSTPAWSGVPHWADDGTPIANFSTDWSPHHVSFDPVHHWLWITDHNRLLRVSNYAAATASGGDLLVDMVIGQTSKGATSCNQGQPATPSAYTLCSGGKTAVDPGGNLFVVDVADAQIDLQAGNNRILGYKAADLAGASGLFPNVPATWVFSDHNRFDEVSGFGTGPPAVIAFDSLGRMYLPNHCGFRLETQTHDGFCYWEMVVFASPFTKQTPDYYLRLPSGWSPGIGFDESNNLVWADTSASRVTVINPVNDPVWLTPMASYRFHIDQGTNPFSLQAGGPSYPMNLGIYTDAVSPGSPVPVEFTLGPVPPGVSANWSTTTSCTGSPCWVELDLTASPSAARGAYSLPIMATSTEGLRRYVVARFRIDGPLTCTGPAVAGIGQTIAFFAHGGTGTTEFYEWSSAGTPGSTQGATYDVSFPTEGTWTAAVSFGDQTANCSVNVGPAKITSFTPTSGVVGTVVTINGTNLAGATSVTFNGVPATTFTVNSAIKITATVPTTATTGKIAVTTPDGTATSVGTFTVKPSIAGFSPAAGAVGIPVTITGSGFGGTTSVKFNGTTATFTLDSVTQVTATVPANATTGKITVTTPGGTATSLTNFTVAPRITSFTPANGAIGITVTITGANLASATSVKFNGTPATITSDAATQIKATVPSGATTGPISVTTSAGTATSATNFTVNFTPTITSFTPASGAVGTSVTINGTNLTGTTSVRFNGTAASFTVNTDVKITAKVPANATTGKITVTTPGGTATSPADFVVAPRISSFSPTSGVIGSSVTINGANFTGATSVKFNGTPAAFNVDTTIKITATVPAGATTGKMSVTTPAGTATSTGNYTVKANILSFSPTSGAVGASVTITGTAFTGATSVKFNGTAATFTVNTSTQITTSVPANATTGKITVTTAGGTATSASNFTVAPRITSFTPTSGAVGTSVAINGANFTGTTAVKFNGIAATPFTVNSSVKITVLVPAGTSTGKISVTTPAGTATSAADFTVP